MKQNMKKLTIAAVVASACAAGINANAEARSMDQGKFYGAARVGYGWTKYGPKKAKVTGKGMLGTLAFGYNASNNVRGEIEAYMDDGLKSKKKNETKLNVKSLGGLLNAYYDFKNQSAFTPYISAGIGYMQNKAKITFINDTTGQPETVKGKRNSFAWQAGLGIGFEAAKNVNLEVGYRLLQKTTSNVKLKDDNGSFKVQLQHNALVGLRLSF